MDYRVIPRCAFTIPEYAAVGLAEEEALAGQPIKVCRFPFKSLGMAQAMGELEGSVKIIAHADTDQIIGAHIIGAHAADLISEIALAMQAGLPSRMIKETIHGHPTLGEAVLEVAQALHLGHNLETVPRLYPEVRRGADYHRSLHLLRQAKAKAPRVVTKSGLMLGLGETENEIEAVLDDLLEVQCDMLTLGQYLAPSLGHAPTMRYLEQDEFNYWRERTLEKGFKSVAAGSLVRSSYKASLHFREMT
jgi:lipoate synthase